ncbi:MAG: glycoside hydrolase family 55 protein [Pirellulales bacterium]|nr:glycoside hydrolase family 55 protein [Pirellulales bacterium]
MFNRLTLLAICAFLLFVAFFGPIASAQAVDPTAQFSFPRDASVLDARRDFGAVGDGKADDTAALQAAIDASCGTDPKFRGKSNLLFVPKGTYRVTNTLVVKSALGPWVWGESRDGVIIKLDDGVKNVNSVLRTHPNEKGPTSADWFMRNLRNFTIDAGNNPQTDGIRYYATNSGCLQNVRVIGQGKVGVNGGFLDQSGPNLIQDVEIDGFETGILSQWIWSQTLSRIKISNCRKVGVEVTANVVAIEDLTVENTPLAIDNKVPNDWGHWGGMIALVNGKFSGGDPHGPAIRNESGLYARNVTATGFGKMVASKTERGDVAGDRIDQYISYGGKRLFDGTPERSVQLPIQPEPAVPWEHDHAKWLCADEYGINANDHEDDTAAIQRAFDAAGKEGKTVVYFRGCGGSEPNWIKLSKPIRVPAPVRLVLGLGWGRLLREGENGGFVVDDASAPQVKFQNLDSFGGPPIQITNASAKNTMVVEGCGVTVIGQGSGDIFVTDCPSHIHLRKAGQNCWARQLNPEGNSDTGVVQNDGGNLWCLGVKHEGRGVRFATRNGGKTEILGLFYYGGFPDEDDQRPVFDIVDSSFSVAGLREIAFDSHTATVKVRERRGAVEKILDKQTEGGWIGWTLFSGMVE